MFAEHFKMKNIANSNSESFKNFVFRILGSFYVVMYTFSRGIS